jgi:hypothetical protein
MAAEAFLSQRVDVTPNTPPAEDLQQRLEAGNTHITKFLTTQAEQFTSDYEVLAQYRNDPQLLTGSGFSARFSVPKSQTLRAVSSPAS